MKLWKRNKIKGMEMKKYKRGYLIGTFDLFHIGHLNMIKRAKDMCEHLVVGTYIDEYVRYYKSDYPFIPQDERLKILESIKYVDEIVIVDFKTVDIVKAHDKWNYDVHFAGSDHEQDKPLFESWFVGKDVSFEFFPYTQSTSSTKIKSLINGKISGSDSEHFNLQSVKLSSVFSEKELYRKRYEAVIQSFLYDYVIDGDGNICVDFGNEKRDICNKPIIIYGAGKRGKKLAMNFPLINKKVLGFIDADESKYGFVICGIKCAGLDDFVEYADKALVISTVADKNIVEKLELSGYRVLDVAATRFLI